MAILSSCKCPGISTISALIAFYRIAAAPVLHLKFIAALRDFSHRTLIILLALVLIPETSMFQQGYSPAAFAFAVPGCVNAMDGFSRPYPLSYGDAPCVAVASRSLNCWWSSRSLRS